MPGLVINRRNALTFLAGSAAGIFLSRTASAQQCPAPSSGGLTGMVVANAEQAATLVLAIAEEANRLGTFGVGGAIIENSTGRVIQVMHNNVLRLLGEGIGSLSCQPYTADPTAHGERQLVSWYFANRKGLPPAGELTIVTSLDPCAMCAGSLLVAGFNVAVVAHDDFAGVDWDFAQHNESQPLFEEYPTAIKDGLQQRFGYYAVGGKRAYSGAADILFSTSEVGAQTARACLHVFADNVGAVRDASNNSGLDPRDPGMGMYDLATLPESDLLRQRFQAAFPLAMQIKLDPPRVPTPEVLSLLKRLAGTGSPQRNAVAFFDYYGNLLMASADQFDVSPIDSAFMKVVQNYSALRFGLVNDPATSVTAVKTLTGPKFGMFAFLFAPDGLSPASLKDLGAYGSTMEGPLPITLPGNFQYFLPPRRGSIEDLQKLIASMPPLYPNLIKIDPQQVKA